MLWPEPAGLCTVCSVYSANKSRTICTANRVDPALNAQMQISCSVPTVLEQNTVHMHEHYIEPRYLTFYLDSFREKHYCVLFDSGSIDNFDHFLKKIFFLL